MKPLDFQGVSALVRRVPNGMHGGVSHRLLPDFSYGI